jgi:hypothetical protein
MNILAPGKSTSEMKMAIVTGLISTLIGTIGPFIGLPEPVIGWLIGALTSTAVGYFGTRALVKGAAHKADGVIEAAKAAVK